MNKKDLTVSNIERQNILNNRYAVDEIQKQLKILQERQIHIIVVKP